MSINLLEMMSSSIGQQLIGQAGKFLGESDNAMSSGVGAALPALLGGLVQKVGAPGGSSILSGLINNPGLDTGMLSNLGGLLGNTDKASGVKTIADGVDVLTFNQDGKITRKNAFRKPVVVQK